MKTFLKENAINISKLYSVSVDNCTTMTKLYKLLVRELTQDKIESMGNQEELDENLTNYDEIILPNPLVEDKENKDVKLVFEHTRTIFHNGCIIHSLMLVIKELKGIHEFETLINKIIEVVKIVRRLKHIYSLPHIPIYFEVRWNTLINMLEAFVQHKEKIFAEVIELKGLEINEEEFELIKSIMTILKPIKDIIKKLSKRNANIGIFYGWFL